MIKIYGHSDDLLEIEAGKKSDEIGCYEGRAAVEIHTKDGRGARVIGEYAPSNKGVWRLSIEPIDEDFPFLPAQAVIASGYSAAFVFDTDPADVSISRVTDAPKGDSK